MPTVIHLEGCADFTSTPDSVYVPNGSNPDPKVMVREMSVEYAVGWWIDDDGWTSWTTVALQPRQQEA